QVGWSLVKHESRKRLSVIKRDRNALRLRSITWQQRAQEPDEIGGLGSGHIAERRHTGGRHPIANRRCQLLISPRRYACCNGGPQFTTIAIAAMTSGAPRYECKLTGHSSALALSHRIFRRIFRRRSYQGGH